jgi:hypothetical protein
LSEKPNRICKYSGCELGEDGGRKAYYACNDCDRNTSKSWRAIGCCFQHYLAYTDEVMKTRGGKPTLEEKNKTK